MKSPPPSKIDKRSSRTSVMSRDAIRFCVKRKEMYDNPELVDQLYLNNKGFVEIKNLEKFVGVESLFLEGNALTRIENLTAQKMLKALHLQNNKIEKIENLDHLSRLKSLNLSNNLITKIDGLSELKRLESLIIKGNRLTKPESIKNVICIKRLKELDLSRNRINCSPDSILQVLAQCKSLKILSLKGNPVAKMKHHRKLVISRIPTLVKLDSRQICKEERRRCDAWGAVVANGGSFDEADEAGREELTNIRSERSELNSLKRRQAELARWQSDDKSSIGSSLSRSIGASVLVKVKKTFGLLESRTPSSNISWSSRRNLDGFHVDAADDIARCKSLEMELEKTKSIVEWQRNEIIGLKKNLAVSNVPSSIDEDSERESGYSIVRNEQLASQAGLKAEMHEAVADFQQWEACIAQDKESPSTAARSSSIVSPGLGSYDPFLIFPPTPPARHSSV